MMCLGARTRCRSLRPAAALICRNAASSSLRDSFFFDVGVVNELSRRGELIPGSAEFGAAFEHFIFMEIRAHVAYSLLHYPVAYWRTFSGFEVDFVLADGALAVEAKSTDNPAQEHLKGLRAFREESRPKRSISKKDDKEGAPAVCRIGA